MPNPPLEFPSYIQIHRSQNNWDIYDTGRIISEHKERYIVRLEKEEVDAEITGALRFAARSREDFPAIGDWVALTVYEGGLGIIHHIYPRFSSIKRKAVGQFGEVQLIAVNIDVAFIVQAVDRDFNINRLERYLAICNASGVKPVIVLSKIDLISNERYLEIEQSIHERISNVQVLAISNESPEGIDSIRQLIEEGKTYCLLGSSGVGKSTLLNNLTGRESMRTSDISSSTHKGRHTTSHRELIFLENGAMIIDNPGMREVGMSDAASLESTFDQIFRYSKNCRFKDCSHAHEAGCAVIAAVESGDLDRDSYENYLKMDREKAHFEASVEEKRKKDKAFGKMVKNYKKLTKGK